MQERYLYRGKRIDNGEWVEGFYFCMIHPDGRHTHHFIIPLGTDLSLGTPIEKIQVEVDPSTICQCTGLKDKNGKPIWENDIVKCGSTTVVIWDEHFAGWCLTKKRWMFPHFFGEAQSPEDCEVIGNKLDNPELLEV